MLVVVLILALMAAVTIPTFKGRFGASYEDALIQELQSLAAAITAYQQDVGKYPPDINYLSALPASPLDGCATHNLTASQIAKYRGPYISRTISATQTSYVFGNKDTIQTVFDFPDSTAAPNGGYTHWLGIQVKGPDQTTVQNIDLKVDGVSNQNNGIIRYVFQAGLGQDYLL
ncbi:MAG TPA: hypothetical protein VKT80_16160, partial [Chloroflexota bacterium]|nr:hypothetical protein [Chloroflexota bacterium]